MMDFESATVEVNDFTGGMTDFPFQGSKDQYEKAENLNVTYDKKLATRPGSAINSAVVYQIPSGSHRISGMFSFENSLFVQSARNLYVANTSSWTTIANPNPAFSSGETTNFIAQSFWNRHIFLVNDSFTKPIKVFQSGGSYVVRTAGLPKMAAPIGSGTAGSDNFVYAFTYAVQYTIGTTIFEDEGPTVLVEIDNVNSPDVNPINFTGIPVLANGSFDNYDTANIKVRIYRTETNGPVQYFVAEIPNGTTTYSDTTADLTIVNNVVLYTTGGVVDNDPPPLAKYIHIVNNVALYCHVKEGTEVLPTRIRQSNTDDPDSCPETFFAETQDEITGVSSHNSNPIVFCKNKAYRIEGTFDELGNGGMFPVEFSETIGCLNHNSIVQTKIGVFFAGNDGFYWTDAYQVKKISESLLTTYFNATETQIQKDRVFGTYDRDNNKVLWAMTQATAQVDNNIIFCCDLRWGIRENSVFTTWTGSTSFAPTALCYHNKLLRRADRRGYLLYHSDKLLTDPKIDEALLPSLWTKQTIFYDYRSTQMNFGLPQIRKWVQRILISLKNVSNVSLKTYSHNDDSNKFVPLTEVKNTTQPIWGDPLLIWGEDTPLWNFYELIEEERRFPAGTLRSSYKQIKFTNSYTVIEKSDDPWPCHGQ
jgi:hypothetical protein